MGNRDDNAQRTEPANGKVGLNPRLVELVRHLARVAAERDYGLLHLDGKTPPEQGEDQ